MGDIIRINNQAFEYDFLAGWIKYNRLDQGMSQEALAHGICSKSHLSYFESGKKKLKEDVLVLLLNKLGIDSFEPVASMGLLRQKLYHMTTCIEYLNLEEADQVFKDIQTHDAIIKKSPYNMEYKIYQLHYDYFVANKHYNDLKETIDLIDKIYPALTEDQKYLYMLTCGRMMFSYVSHKEGIRRLMLALEIKETPVVNYYLGFAFCFDDDPLRGVFYFEKALESYRSSGRYINAVMCHNYLGICYTSLKIYDQGEEHFKTGITGAEHFSITLILGHLYTNIAHLYMCTDRYDLAEAYVKKGVENFDDPLLPISNLIEIYERMGQNHLIQPLFEAYLVPERMTSKYYLLLEFQYRRLCTPHDKAYYEALANKILPFYEKIHYIELSDMIRKAMIDYLESVRQYKAANQLYKTLLRMREG